VSLFLSLPVAAVCRPGHRALLSACASSRPSWPSFGLRLPTLLQSLRPVLRCDRLRLSPLPDRFASPSALPAACTVVRASNSAVLSVDWLAPPDRTFRRHLRSSRQLAPPTEAPILLSCPLFDLRLTSSLPALPSISAGLRLWFDLRLCFPNRSPACAFARLVRLTFRAVRQLAPRATLPDLPSCLAIRLAPPGSAFQPFLLLYRSACALD
jgi:hypothetical protein